MQRKFFLSVVLFGLFFIAPVTNAAVVIKKPAPTNGLVGYWKFDELSGTTAQDSSGQANAGTLQNGATRVAGKEGTAVSFDGSDDHVSLASDAGVSALSEVTISAWVKTNTEDVWQGVVGSQGGGTGYHFQINTDNHIQLYVYTSVTNAGAVGSVDLSGYIDQWVHVVGTYDGTNVRVYVDGVLDATESLTGSILSATDMRIGQTFNGDRYFSGAIDDVRIYNRALSEDEIVDLWSGYLLNTTKVNMTAVRNEQKAAVGGWTNCANEGGYCSFSGTKLVRYGTGGTYYTNNHTDGVACTNEVWGDPTPGQSKVCEYQEIGVVGLAAHYTFDGVAVSGDTIQDISGNANHGTRNPELYGPGGDGWEISGASMYPEFNGEYIVCTECGTNDGKPIYKMGADYFLWYEQTEWYDEFMNETYIDTVWQLNVGDIWSVYYMAWGSYVVGDGYEYGTPCDWPDAAGCWWDDGIVATELVASGPVVGGANKWAVPGKMGQAMKFNGVDEYVSVSDSELFNFADSDFSLSYWIKWDETPAGIDSIIGQSNGGGTQPKWSMIWGLGATGYTYAGTHMRFSFVDDTNTDRNIAFPWVPQAGVWYQLTLTRTGSNWNFYVNGVQTGDTEVANYVLSNPTSALQIGSDGESWNWFKGTIDDVRIYNKALTASEIVNLYGKTANNKVVISSSQNTKNTNGLVGLWSFNGPDISGTTAYDRSGNNNDGTLTNGPKVAIGKVGQALSFDGVDDYVDLSGESSYDMGSGPWTISVWMKTATTSSNRKVVTKSSDVFDGASGFETLINYGFNGSVGIGNSGYIKYSDDININDNKWHYVVYRYDGSGSASGYTIYVDGTVVDLPNSGGSFTTPTNNNFDVLIGVSRAFADEYFQGMLDDVRIYDRALSAAEIQALYKAK